MKKRIKRLVKNLGFEISRYTPQTSKIAQMQRIFAYHKIDLVLDVGANIGQYVNLLRESGYSGRIVSFEPLSSAHSKLQALSSKDPLWEIAPRTAIGDKDGEIAINISQRSASSSILPMLESHIKVAPDSTYCGSETVKLSQLNTIAKNFIKNDTKSIFLKIDVQGFEKQVIEGATQILPLVKGIQLELSLVPLYKDQALFEEMLEQMKKLGYDLYALSPGLVDPETGRLLQMDGIFFKR